MSIKRKIAEINYRMKIRKEIGNLDIELVKITIEESQKEYDRRKKELTKTMHKR